MSHATHLQTDTLATTQNKDNAAVKQTANTCQAKQQSNADISKTKLFQYF